MERDSAPLQSVFIRQTTALPSPDKGCRWNTSIGRAMFLTVTARTTIDRRTIRSRPDHQHEEADASEANNASRVGLFVEIGGQIVGANSLRCLLTAFHANDRQRDFPDQDLAQKFLDGEVTEIIAAHPLDRDRSERALLAISAPAQQFPVA